VRLDAFLPTLLDAGGGSRKKAVLCLAPPALFFSSILYILWSGGIFLLLLCHFILCWNLTSTICPFRIILTVCSSVLFPPELGGVVCSLYGTLRLHLFMAIETHGPLLIGVSWVLVIVSCIFLSLRIYCKHVRSRGLWWDDGFLISAWVCPNISFCRPGCPLTFPKKNG
jgi:hypothetical protein